MQFNVIPEIHYLLFVVFLFFFLFSFVGGGSALIQQIMKSAYSHPYRQGKVLFGVEC